MTMSKPLSLASLLLASILLSSFVLQGADLTHSGNADSNGEMARAVEVGTADSARTFVAAAFDGSTVYEIDLIEAGLFVDDTWGTVRTCTVPGLADNVGIDYDGETGLLYHSDLGSTHIVVTDLDCNVIGSFDCPSPGGFNSGVTYVEGSQPPEVWVTDWISNTTTRCEALFARGALATPAPVALPDTGVASLSELDYTGPGLVAPGDVIEQFTNTWASLAVGLVYDPSRDWVRYAHTTDYLGEGIPTIYSVDWPSPHPLLGQCVLSAVNDGWPATLNNREGAGYDFGSDTYFLPDYEGDLTIRDDNIVEIDPQCNILHAWEIDGADNDSYDGSAVDKIVDIAVVPGAGIRSSISGWVTDAEDQPIPGVTVSAGGGNTALTNAYGFYIISDLITGTYTVTPLQAGYAFSPTSRTASVPPSAAEQDFVGTPVPLKLKLLFVPLQWEEGQQAFDIMADTQADAFLDEVPLQACRNQTSVETLDVATQNFDGFTCSVSDCGLDSIRAFVSGELAIDPTDYDLLVGLAETSPCPPTAGCSNGTHTLWVTPADDTVTAHEIGQIFGLAEEYCSNQAGSADDRCNDGDVQGDGATTGDVNWLDASLLLDCPPDGSDDSTGWPCCNFGETDCSIVDYGVCCLGNKNAAGGRSTMSYADAPGPRGFDDHDLAHLGTLPELNCGSLAYAPGLAPSGPTQDASQTLIDANLAVHPDDAVDEERVSMTRGRPTADSVLQALDGDYTLAVVDAGGATVWSQAFGLYYDYSGPVLLGVDYGGISYDAADVSFRIPHTQGMSVLELYHGEDLIYSRTLLFEVYLPLVLRSR
jgi:hypothetical protein